MSEGLSRRGLIKGILASMALLVSRDKGSAKPEPQKQEIPIVYPQKKTIIGKTTNQEIEKSNLLRPKALKVGATDTTIQQSTREENPATGEIIYTIPSELIARPDKIITKNGVAIFERVVTMGDSSQEKDAQMSEFEKYGNPEKTFTGSIHYGDPVQTNVYSSKGLAIIFYPYTGEVLEIQIFQPTSVDNYVKNWGQDIKQQPGQLAKEP